MVPFISQDFIDAKLFSFSASRRGQFLYLLTQGTDEVNDLSEGTVQQRKCRIASSHLLGALFFFSYSNSCFLFTSDQNHPITI